MEKTALKTPPASALAGTTAAPAAPRGLESHTAKPAAAVVPAAAHSVPLFGGHRGGGKKRLDGLPAGSEEAKAADREKAKLRMRDKRAGGKGTPLPASLPSVAVSAPDPAADSPAAVAGGAGAVSVPAAGAGVAVVLWNPRLLEKPAKLVTRIVDRVRKAAFRKKLDHPKLPADLKAEIERDLQLPNEALADFSTALADCAAVELNKRGVGAGQSHWLTLAGSVVELGTHHLQAMERLDKLIAKLDESPAAEPAKAEAPKP